MSLLKRISDLVRSNVNDVLDKAEDPRKILDQTIMDMQGEHKKAKKMLLDTMTLLKQAEKQADKYEKAAVEWEQKAMSALKTGSEDLARQALSEKQKNDELGRESRGGVEQQRTYTEELKRQLTMLEAKIDEAKKKRDELVARMQAAEMKKKQVEDRSGTGRKDFTGESGAFDTFNRMVDKIETSEAEVAARAELLGDRAPEIDYQLSKQLEADSAEAALEALKAKMGSGGAAPAPAGPPPSKGEDPKADAIEDELARLRAKLDG